MFVFKELKESLNLKFVILVVTSCLGIFFLWFKSHSSPSNFLGYVEGEFVRVASPIAGSLTHLPLRRGMNVNTGDTLFVLERENEIAARDEALRRYEKAIFNLENLRVGKRPEELEVIAKTLLQAEADQDYNRRYLERQEQLVKSNAASQAILDRARSNYARGQALIDELNAQFKVAQLPAREMEIKAAQKEMGAAKAVLAQAQWRVNQKTISSPVSGFVFDTLYVPGEWVTAGSPISVILPPENIKVRFFVPEGKLGLLKVGQSLEVLFDGQKEVTPAIINYISRKAEFTPPVIYSREWRTKQMYMIEALPTKNRAFLHPGQPVDVKLGNS